MAFMLGAFVVAIFRILRNAIRAIWRPVGKAINHAIVAAIAVLLGVGVLKLVQDQPELLRIVLAIGILVLALRLIWRHVRNGLRF